MLNGLLAGEIDGQPFEANLRYVTEPTNAIMFDISIGAEFEETIELDFSEGMDLGFAELGIYGGADAMVNAEAKAELTVGVDLDAPPVPFAMPATSQSLRTFNDGLGRAVQCWAAR